MMAQHLKPMPPKETGGKGSGSTCERKKGLPGLVVLGFFKGLFT